MGRPRIVFARDGNHKGRSLGDRYVSYKGAIEETPVINDTVDVTRRCAHDQGKGWHFEISWDCFTQERTREPTQEPRGIAGVENGNLAAEDAHTTPCTSLGSTRLNRSRVREHGLGRGDEHRMQVKSR